MAIIFDGTQGITTPAETANNSVTTPVVKSGSALTLQTNGSTTAVTIDTSQNVGIGTSSPAATLHVNGTGNQYSRLSSSTHNNFIQAGCLSGNTFHEYKSVYRLVDTDVGERMRIDSSGRVTLPYQTRFHATGNGQTPVIDGITQFPIIKENVGNCYNNSTMRFTAPIAGTYYFYGAIMANSGTGRMTWQFYKNGNTIQYMQGGGDSTNFGTWPGMMIITLAANDYIVMVCGQTPYTSTQEQYFGGYLIG